MKLPTMSSIHALSFAHLIGLGAAVAAKPKKGERDDRKEGESDEEMRARHAKEDKAAKDHADDGDGDASASATTEDEDEENEDEDEEDGVDDDDKDQEGDDSDAKKSKRRARRSSKKAFVKGRAAERARCALIFASPAAGRNVAMAAQVAFTTNLSAKAAIALLGTAPAASRLADRMAPHAGSLVAPGAPEQPKGAVAIANSWDAATKDYAQK